VPVPCEESQFIAAIPIFESENDITSLAFIEATPSAGQEVLVGSQIGVNLVASDGTSSVIATARVVDLDVADLDGDDDEDIVLLDAGAAPIALRTLLADDGGAFVEAASAETTATRVGLGDFDVDGLVDLVSDADGTLSIYPGLGDGSFSATSSIGIVAGPIEALLVAPLHGGIVVPPPGGPDLAFQAGTWTHVAIGVNGYMPQPLFPMPLHLATPYAFTVGDYDGDGSTDLVAIDGGQSPTVIQIWPSAAQTEITELAHPWQPPVSYRVAASGDIDGDGYDELALASSDGQLAVRFGGDWDNTASPDCYETSTVGGGTTSQLLLGDFDGDGLADLMNAAGATLWWTKHR
jgi:hypothetical protein